MVVVEDDGDKNDILRQKRGGDRQYVYDAAFGEDSTQVLSVCLILVCSVAAYPGDLGNTYTHYPAHDEHYEEVYAATTRILVNDVLNGYNATVFAYGATGSGKTYTMVGSPEQPGIMVRALNDLFLAVQESQNHEQFSVNMSYLEIYNENIRDLLNPGSGYLELREDSRGQSIQVAKLSEISTTSTDEVMRLLQRGNRARTVEPTAANRTSSRSHALLSVTVRQTSPLHNQEKLRARVKQGKLFMIDLAGSERASNTKNRGKRLQEGAHINRSLLALGNCINALSGGARYVNYRDSKLTRLLKDALSGNCKTVMVAHISPASVHREESRTTLLYADRAKNISKKVERNVLDVSYHVSQYRTIINELREEINRLRSKMENRPRSGLHSAYLGEQIKGVRDQIVRTFRDQMKLRRKLMDLDGQLLSLGAEAERQHLLISQWESKNNKLYKSSHRNTAQGWRPNTSPDLDLDRDLSDAETSDEVLQQAWAELNFIEKGRERCLEMREKTEKELEKVRQRGAELEDELPSKISSDEERELLGLMCRVHELEVEKMALQSERLIKQHELRRRDLVIIRFDRQRQLCEEIITRQRQLMEEGSVFMPPDLQELYRVYQQEIHAAIYADTAPIFQSGLPHSSYTRERDKAKLPPINQSGEPLFQKALRFTPVGELVGSSRMDSEISLRTPISSASSEYSHSPLPLIPSAGIDQVNHHVTGPPPAVLFPPISGLDNGLHENSRTDLVSSPRMGDTPFSRLPRPVPRNSSRNLRRVSSDDNLVVSADKMRPRSIWPK